MEHNSSVATSDKGCSLSQIARQQNKSIISLLVDIQPNHSDKPIEPRLLSFIKNLECLEAPTHPRSSDEQAPKTEIRRRSSIDATKTGSYVALSYTWDPSDHEEDAKGAYLVQKRHSPEFEPSRPRNDVLDRIFPYMRTIGIDLLWVDQHSLLQEQDVHNCSDPPRCKEGPCAQMRQGMAVMDLVYSCSDHPVGLLGRPITLSFELYLLSILLQGHLTTREGSEFKLSREGKLVAWMVVDMLSQITDDKWWRRGWIFQENFRGGTKMKLLISCHKDLESLKRDYGQNTSPCGTPIFGDVPVEGELCISSVNFFEQTTRLCLACRGHIDQCHSSSTSDSKLALRKDVLSGIRDRAGKYDLILGSSKPMTPRIVSDIDKKDISKPWDRLAIVANCCGYAIRLDGDELSRNKSSLSLSILAQCLLNGEVLHNGRVPIHDIAAMTVPEYLEEAIFSELDSSVSTYSLTFRKSCRFIAPFFSQLGVHTRGHIWKLQRVVDTNDWPAQGGWVDTLQGGLSPIQRKQLAYLELWADNEGYKGLAGNLSVYLQRDAVLAEVEDEKLSFTKRYMKIMAGEVADAISKGGSLALGCLWDKVGYSPYMAVFVWPDRSLHVSTETFAFTASRPENASSAEFDFNDLDRHVSFEVDLEGLEIDDRDRRIPSLRIRRWLPGLCFFRGESREEVVFPWPRELEKITP